MKAARLHAVATPFRVDEIETPVPSGADVLVRVRACGVVPNLRNVTHHYPVWFPQLPLPALPAIFGLDPMGQVEALGPQARGVEIGQRVYVNPIRSCGGCEQCRRHAPMLCLHQTMAGYFGLGEKSHDIYARYPWGGFAEYMVAPLEAMVPLPDNVSDEEGARFGYLGTCYSALLKAEAGVRTSILVNGATGTLGVGTVLLALAMGVPKIVAVARNSELLARLRALDPARIEVLNARDGHLPQHAFALTEGNGVDIVVDCLSAGAEPQATMDGLMCLGRGGRLVFIGGMDQEIPLSPHYLMTHQISFHGSDWFTTAEAQDMAIMAGAGVLNLAVLDHKIFDLDHVNEAVTAAEHRILGGFENIVVKP